MWNFIVFLKLHLSRQKRVRDKKVLDIPKFFYSLIIDLGM